MRRKFYQRFKLAFLLAGVLGGCQAPEHAGCCLGRPEASAPFNSWDSCAADEVFHPVAGGIISDWKTSTRSPAGKVPASSPLNPNEDKGPEAVASGPVLSPPIAGAAKTKKVASSATADPRLPARASWENEYLAAVSLMRSVSLADQENRIARSQLEELAQVYGDLAVDLLQQAVHKGLHDSEQMRHDPDLRRLTGRADFHDLLDELDRSGKEPARQDAPGPVRGPNMKPEGAMPSSSGEANGSYFFPFPEVER